MADKNSTISLGAAHVIKTEPLKNEDARWTKLVLTTYKDPAGKVRTWESGERQTRPKSLAVDGVGIVTILENNANTNEPCILLQKQYRAAIDKVCIEVPAGLIDEGESAAECAVRELREETGYEGEVIETGAEAGGGGSAGGGFNGISPVMFNDPGFTNTNLNMVHVRVDLSRPCNAEPQPSLEPNEFIECFTVPIRDLYAECRRLDEQGYAIDARVGTLAEGIEIARRWQLFAK